MAGTQAFMAFRTFGASMRRNWQVLPWNSRRPISVMPILVSTRCDAVLPTRVTPIRCDRLVLAHAQLLTSVANSVAVPWPQLLRTTQYPNSASSGEPSNCDSPARRGCYWGKRAQARRIVGRLPSQVIEGLVVRCEAGDDTPARSRECRISRTGRCQLLQAEPRQCGDRRLHPRMRRRLSSSTRAH